MESQSGLQTLRPRIRGPFAQPLRARTAAIVIRPTSNFLGHDLIGHLAECGIAMLGLNTRDVGNDAVLILEQAIQDLGAGVR